MNPAAEGSAPSPLDKPLSQLTEDDIAQLTREDCRRFLKQKGMRRPSWNKSQAIQQVISLKALVEEDRPASPHPVPPPPPPPPEIPAQQPPLAYASREPRPAADYNKVRDDGAQMTIFYGGRVTVYNEIAAEKARAIMQLAASPTDMDDPVPGSVHSNRVSYGVNPAGVGPGSGAWAVDSESGHAEGAGARQGEEPRDGYTGRHASLQRYREKRKDRYTGKKIIGGPPSTVEMMFLSQKLTSQTRNEQSIQSSLSYPNQPQPPCTPSRCKSVENQARKFFISVDLNDDGGRKSVLLRC